VVVKYHEVVHTGWDIVLLKYVFILLRALKDLSEVESVAASAEGAEYSANHLH